MRTDLISGVHRRASTQRASRTDAGTSCLGSSSRFAVVLVGTEELFDQGLLPVETIGLEPTTPCLQSRCSTN